MLPQFIAVTSRPVQHRLSCPVVLKNWNSDSSEDLLTESRNLYGSLFVNRQLKNSVKKDRENVLTLNILFLCYKSANSFHSWEQSLKETKTTTIFKTATQLRKGKRKYRISKTSKQKSSVHLDLSAVFFVKKVAINLINKQCLLTEKVLFSNNNLFQTWK